MSSSSPEFNEAKDALIKLLQMKGRRACESVLAEFGAKRLSDLPVELLPDFKKRVDNALQM